MGLGRIRQEIDGIDAKMRELFLQRMDLSDQVIEEKKRTGGRVYVPEREKEVMDSHMDGVARRRTPEYGMFLRQIMTISRIYQYSQLELDESLREISGWKGELSIQFICRRRSGQLLAVITALHLAGIDICQMETECRGEEKMLCRIRVFGDFRTDLAKGAVLQIYKENEEVSLEK